MRLPDNSKIPMVFIANKPDFVESEIGISEEKLYQFV